MTLFGRLAAIPTALVLVGCSPAVQEATVDTGPTLDEARTAVTQIVERFDAALGAGDTDALAQLYADDAVRMHPDVPTWIGNTAIREGFEGTSGERPGGQQGSWVVDNTVSNVVVAGEFATARGEFSATFTPEGGGDPVLDSGKWMSLSRRQPDGTWKIVWDIWNRDAPLAEQQSEAREGSLLSTSEPSGRHQ